MSARFYSCCQSCFLKTVRFWQRITPVLGCPKDLVHWSYPNSGSATNVGVTKNPLGKLGADFDMVAPNMMVDDDGTARIISI